MDSDDWDSKPLKTKKRGRPPSIKNGLHDPGDSDDWNYKPKRKKRGRPPGSRKKRPLEPNDSDDLDSSKPREKKRVGRPLGSGKHDKAKMKKRVADFDPELDPETGKYFCPSKEGCDFISEDR